MPSARDFQRTPRFWSRATRILTWVLLGVNLAVFIMAWTSVRQARRRTEMDARTDTHNLAQILERNLSAEFQAADLALHSIKREITREQRQGGLRGPILNDYIQDLCSHFPGVETMRVTDADGNITYGIGKVPGPKVSVADRDYFRTLKAAPATGMVISKPLLGRLSHKWLIILARAHETREGAFGGVVYVALPMDRLTRDLSLVDLGPQGTVALRDGDLGLVIRYPYVKGISDQIGNRKLSAPFKELLAAGQTTGTYTTRAVLDDVERTYSYRKCTEYPFYVIVGLAASDILAQWRRDARVTWGLFSLFAGFSLVLGLLLRGAWRRNEARIRDLRLALEEVRTLQGFLPICMYCRKVRDVHADWAKIEDYLAVHAGTVFSHGICPECRPKLMGDETGEGQAGAP